MSGARRLGASLRGRIGVCAILAIFVILSDQVTKAWALDSLHNGRQIPLLGDFITLQLVHNPGAAFSLGASTTWFFTLLAFVILALLAYGLWRMNSASSAGAIGLLMGGAIGNLIDRLSQPPRSAKVMSLTSSTTRTFSSAILRIFGSSSVRPGSPGNS